MLDKHTHLIVLLTGEGKTIRWMHTCLGHKKSTVWLLEYIGLKRGMEMVYSDKIFDQ
jgi:hypothetical protein